MEHKSSADTTSVRRWNEQRVLEALQDGAALRVSRLASATGLTTAAMRDVLRTLTVKHWIERTALTQGGKGRPAQTFRMRPFASRILGLDIGGHAVRCVLTDDAGVIVHQRETLIEPGRDAVSATRRAVREVLADVDTSEVWSSGIALSGVVDTDGRVLRSIALPHFEGKRPAELLADVLPGHVQTWHDTKAALWAEHTLGVAAGERDVLLLHLGRRPSMALLVDGRLHQGAHGSAGELTLNELIPAEGSYTWSGGSVDDDARGTALRAARAGDPAAVSGAQSFLLELAPQIALAVGLIDPALVVVGGSLASVVAPALPEFGRELARRLESTPEITTTALDQFAAARGALDLSRRRAWGALLGHDQGVMPLSYDSLAEALTHHRSHP